MQDALILSMDSIAESWVIDSDASFHATASKGVLKNYVAGDFRQVYLGDDEPCSIVGMGDVQIETHEFKWCLKDVRHVPQLKRNLVSVGQLGAVGYTSTFTGDAWKALQEISHSARKFLARMSISSLKEEFWRGNYCFLANGIFAWKAYFPRYLLVAKEYLQRSFRIPR